MNNLIASQIDMCRGLMRRGTVYSCLRCQNHLRKRAAVVFRSDFKDNDGHLRCQNHLRERVAVVLRSDFKDNDGQLRCQNHCVSGGCGFYGGISKIAKATRSRRWF